MRTFVILALLSSFLPSLGYGAEPLTLDEALATALRGHPLETEARENVVAAEGRIGQAQAGYLPQVSVVTDGTKTRAYFPTLEDSQRADIYTVGISVKQTLWDFGRTAGREASARILSTAKEVAAAHETQTLALERYREGVGIVLEVTDAQAQALTAETANVRATFDYLVALARLDWAVGRKP